MTFRLLESYSINIKYQFQTRCDPFCSDVSPTIHIGFFLKCLNASLEEGLKTMPRDCVVTLPPK